MNNEPESIEKEGESPLKEQILTVVLNVANILLVVCIAYIGFLLYMKKSSEPIVKQEVQTVKTSGKIQIDILNGCGIPGLADKFTEYLRHNGVDVVNSANYSSFNINETLIIDRAGNREKAEHVAQLLGVDFSRIVELPGDRYLLDISIIFGRDYKKFKPFTNESK